MHTTAIPPQAQHRYGWLEILFSPLVIAALSFLLFFALVATGSLAMTSVLGLDGAKELFEKLREADFLKGSRQGQIILQTIGILLYTAVGSAIWIIAHVPRRVPFKQRVALQRWTFDRHFAAVFLFAAGYAVLSGLWLEWIKPEAKEWVTLPKAHLPLLLAFIVIVFIGPFIEELFFRGWMFTALRSRLAFLPTLLITSIIFALMHFEKSLLYALVVFPVGLVLGYVRERYGSTLASSAFHCAYNLFAFTLTFYELG